MGPAPAATSSWALLIIIVSVASWAPTFVAVIVFVVLIVVPVPAVHLLAATGAHCAPRASEALGGRGHPAKTWGQVSPVGAHRKHAHRSVPASPGIAGGLRSGLIDTREDIVEDVQGIFGGDGHDGIGFVVHRQREPFHGLAEFRRLGQLLERGHGPVD